MPKPKVLIVEDEFLIFKKLHILFEEWGFDVITEAPNKAVDNYDAAVALLNVQVPNLAVLDISLKGRRDGLELGRYIKNRFGIPVVLFTGNATDVNHHRADQIQAEGFVLKGKSISTGQLRSTVKSMMSKIVQPPPPPETGAFFKVRKRADASAKDSAAPDFADHVRYFRWDDLRCIKSHGPANQIIKNNVFFYTTSGEIYIHHGSLNETEQKLPPYFVRVNQTAILNLYCITRYAVGTNACYVNEERFDITPTYKEKVVEKINEYLGRVL